MTYELNTTVAATVAAAAAAAPWPAWQRRPAPARAGPGAPLFGAISVPLAPLLPLPLLWHLIHG